ncbi:uncharacterized protein LY89DRAFT_719338 [Mollisia scopiformis]|uniref:Uncharacterized protein n=1 Tax=Mollisia scopiformis TaxID=149040 RepID=A0A194X5Z8_MOLSC|nr:uncharacterized protein LY89DRAFT_719338 [Mollisia scopiformis]KUJ15606.1 hypothetical protein LY89DRAFT_719338 [Mollisia scopiformis]
MLIKIPDTDKEDTMRDPIHNALDAGLRALGGEKGALASFWRKLREKDKKGSRVHKESDDPSDDGNYEGYLRSMKRERRYSPPMPGVGQRYGGRAYGGLGQYGGYGPPPFPFPNQDRDALNPMPNERPIPYGLGRDRDRRDRRRGPNTPYGQPPLPIDNSWRPLLGYGIRDRGQIDRALLQYAQQEQLARAGRGRGQLPPFMPPPAYGRRSEPILNPRDLLRSPPREIREPAGRPDKKRRNSPARRPVPEPKRTVSAPAESKRPEKTPNKISKGEKKKEEPKMRSPPPATPPARPSPEKSVSTHSSQDDQSSIATRRRLGDMNRTFIEGMVSKTTLVSSSWSVPSLVK